MKRNILTGCILLCLAASSAPAQENIRVLERWMRYTDASNSLYHYLSAEGAGFLESRKKEVEACTTPEQWKARQEKIRKILMDIAGPFPPKTPLNARITGKFRGDGFRVERIV